MSERRKNHMFEPVGPVQAEFKFYDPKHGEVTYTCQLDGLDIELVNDTVYMTSLPEELLDQVCIWRDTLTLVMHEQNLVPYVDGKYGKIKTKRSTE